MEVSAPEAVQARVMLTPVRAFPPRWVERVRQIGLVLLLLAGLAAELFLMLQRSTGGTNLSSAEQIEFAFSSALPLLLIGAVMWMLAKARQARQLRALAAELETMLRQNWVQPLPAGFARLDAPVLLSLNRLIDHVQNREAVYSDYMVTNCVLSNEIKQIQRTLDSASVGIIGVDANRNVFLGNRAAESFLKGNRDQWRGRPAQHALLDEPVVGLLTADSDGGSHSTLSVELPPDSDRNRGYMSVTRSSFISEADEVEGQALIFLDIDRQKNLERMQGEFLDNVAHEFRTPLTSIIASVEMLQQNLVTDQAMRDNFYNIIHEETYRLSNLIDTLLNISMMERGALSLNEQPARLKKFIEEIVEVIRPQCSKKKIELLVDLPDRLPTFNMDKHLFNVAVLNVVGNAVKYTPEGGRILLEIASKEDSIIIVVQDTGMGIAEEHQQRIFEKFYRVPSKGGEVIKGNGIGLAFARQIVRMHGGDIKVQSKLEEGSRFFISLPRSLINNAIGE